MKSLRLGPWLLVPWYERVGEGRQVEIDEPADAARLLRRLLENESPIALRAFVREHELGAPLDFHEGELIGRLAVMVARRRVQLIHFAEVPIASDPVEVVEYTREPAPLEDIIDELELVDWSCELEADEPVWFEVASEPDPDEPVGFEVASELEDLPAFSAELSASAPAASRS